MELSPSAITGLVGAAVAAFSAFAAWSANRKTTAIQNKQVDQSGQVEGQKITLDGYKDLLADTRAENDRLQGIVNGYRERDQKHLDDKAAMQQAHVELTERHLALLELHEEQGEELAALKRKEPRRAR